MEEEKQQKAEIVMQTRTGPLSIQVPKIVKLFQRRSRRPSSHNQRQNLNFKGALEINNPGNDLMTVKVISYDKENLLVNPEYGIIPPQDRAVIQIRLKDILPLENCSEKFFLRILATTCKASSNTILLREIVSYWNGTLKDNCSFMEQFWIKKFHLTDLYGVLREVELGKCIDYVADNKNYPVALTLSDSMRYQFDLDDIAKSSRSSAAARRRMDNYINEVTTNRELSKYRNLFGVLALLMFIFFFQKMLSNLELEIILISKEAEPKLE